jgi:L-asparaginase
MTKDQRKPKIAVIGTGGTISGAGRHSLDLYEYMEFGRKMDVNEIIGLFPEVHQVADIVPIDYIQVGSSAVTPLDWLALTSRIHHIAETMPEIDGVVITHGTATLEETAYFLNLALKTDLPVVVIGAQRPSSGFATDAGMNLLCAARVAGSPEARGLGVMVLLNEEIQAAREVTKTSTFRLETFRSPDLGMLGYADADGRVAIYRRPMRSHAPDTEFDVSGLDILPRVDISYSYAGADGAALEAFIAAGAKAIVLGGFAPGMVTPLEKPVVEAALAKGIVVIQSTRAGSGRVLRRTSMIDQGIVAADNLNPQKARVLAMLALTVTQQPEEVQRIFDTY